MNRFLKSAFFIIVLIGGLISIYQPVHAGNDNRSGEAGAAELLINPWARSSGWVSANNACIKGLEASFINVAGLAFTKKTELLFSRTNYLAGTGISINSFGLAQKVGSSSAFSVGIMSMNFGDIDITTVNNPEGGIGKFSPNYTNINLSYAKEFSNSIYGGVNVKVINERIANVTAKGAAIDAGIQYLTGTNEEKNNIHFGISLRNVGPPMKYSGDGLSFKGPPPSGSSTYTMTLQQRATPFELPSQLNISGAYDFKLAPLHRLTAAGTFVSNSFGKNQFNLGVEYGFKTYLMVRAGYMYEQGILKSDTRTSIYTGPAAGVTFEVPINSKGTSLGIDYSYRTTNYFQGCHVIGIKLNL